MMIRIDLPADVWRSVEAALRDYMRFGPGEMDSEYVPDEHLDKACQAIHDQVGVRPPTAEEVKRMFAAKDAAARR